MLRVEKERGATRLEADQRAHLVTAMQAIERGVALRDPRAVEYAAVKGMLLALDPLSSFLEPASVAEMRRPVQRERVPGEPVAATLLDGGVAWAKLSGFGRSARRDLQAALERLRARDGGELRGVVLDLRGNAGGVLDEAIEVADLFLSEGVIVAVRGGARPLYAASRARRRCSRPRYTPSASQTTLTGTLTQAVPATPRPTPESAA
jgi:C-terminal processing protease CtpA/Prc